MRRRLLGRIVEALAFGGRAPRDESVLDVCEGFDSSYSMEEWPRIRRAVGSEWARRPRGGWAQLAEVAFPSADFGAYLQGVMRERISSGRAGALQMWGEFPVIVDEHLPADAGPYVVSDLSSIEVVYEDELAKEAVAESLRAWMLEVRGEAIRVPARREPYEHPFCRTIGEHVAMTGPDPSRGPAVSRCCYCGVWMPALHVLDGPWPVVGASPAPWRQTPDPYTVELDELWHPFRPWRDWRES